MIARNGDFFCGFPKLAIPISQLRPEFSGIKAFSAVFAFGMLLALYNSIVQNSKGKEGMQRLIQG